MSAAPRTGLIRIDHDGPQHGREFADEHLDEAEQIVRELFPEAVSVVLTETDQSDNQNTLRINHILGRHGVLLYSADDRDPYMALVETHLADALRSHPQQR